MNFKFCKVLCLSLVFVLFLTVSTGCSDLVSAAGANEINVYNWGEYIDESVLDDFEKETGIHINYFTFESNEQMYSVLKQGGSSYDVVIPSDYMVSRLIQEGMLEELDFSNIPNAAGLSDAYQNLQYDPTNAYSVPYMWGTVGIIYNTKIVEEEVDSWGILWDEKYAGQILQFNNSRDAFATALLYLGYSLNTTNEQALQEAYDLLRDQKPVLQKYVMDQCYDLLESGEAAIGAYYAGDYLGMIENNPDLKFVIPKEGTNRFVDAMCIPKGCRNKELAEAFINYMCRPDISLRNMDEIGYSSPIEQAEKDYKAEFDLSDPDEAYEWSVMFPENAGDQEVYINLPANILNLYNKYWILLKS